VTLNISQTIRDIDRHNRDLQTPYSRVSFRIILSDLEWFSEIFNDTKHRAVSQLFLLSITVEHTDHVCKDRAGAMADHLDYKRAVSQLLISSDRTSQRNNVASPARRRQAGSDRARRSAVRGSGQVGPIGPACIRYQRVSLRCPPVRRLCDVRGLTPVVQCDVMALTEVCSSSCFWGTGTTKSSQSEVPHRVPGAHVDK